jgi:pimeloyl-ACP methyl ester carboxylesterase
MPSPRRQRIRLANGAALSYLRAGAASGPAVLLLHGFPSSARTFQDVIPALSASASVIAPDLPGFGDSEPLLASTFSAYGEAVSELLDRVGIGPRFIYLHDFGAPVGLHIAMREPDKVLGLIVQNANAHRSGLGPAWKDTQAFWSRPTAGNEAAATAHLTLDGTRAQYLSGLPPEIAERMTHRPWEEDWRVMNLPGRMAMHRALIRDYGNYVARFDAVAAHLKRFQPPALMMWGRHDPFFELAEILSWMQALPRMEAHILDGGHFLLETHAQAASVLMLDFIRRLAPAGDFTSAKRHGVGRSDPRRRRSPPR